MQIERTGSDTLVVNKLPDGSTVIVDTTNQTVFALNATAGAAWDACSDPTTLSEVTGRMQRSFTPEVNEDLAQEAILQLAAKNLVKTSGIQPTRRQFITSLGLGAVALPLVTSLPLAEQRAYAQSAGSKGTTTPPPSTPPPDNGGHGILWWILHLLGLV